MLYLLKETKTSFEELYFYFKKTERIDTTALYNNLTQNEKIDLTKERLEQFLSNIGKKLEDMLEIYSEDKTVYTYDDILKLHLDNKDFLMTSSFGHHFKSIHMNYPYTVNPYNVKAYDSFLEKFAEDMTTTDNKKLLIDYGPIYNNMLFVCFAEETLTRSIQYGLSETSTLKIYFPHLYNKTIISLDSLRDKKTELIQKSNDMLSEIFIQTIKNVKQESSPMSNAIVMKVAALE